METEFDQGNYVCDWGCYILAIVAKLPGLATLSIALGLLRHQAALSILAWTSTTSRSSCKSLDFDLYEIFLAFAWTTTSSRSLCSCLDYEPYAGWTSSTTRSLAVGDAVFEGDWRKDGWQRCAREMLLGWWSCVMAGLHTEGPSDLWEDQEQKEEVPRTRIGLPIDRQSMDGHTGDRPSDAGAAWRRAVPHRVLGAEIGKGASSRCRDQSWGAVRQDAATSRYEHGILVP